MNFPLWTIIGAIVALLIWLALSAIRVVQQYERGVMHRFRYVHRPQRDHTNPLTYRCTRTPQSVKLYTGDR
jgi:regulator of protease activity HflC (stomatin/prohibitin superfamily)